MRLVHGDARWDEAGFEALVETTATALRDAGVRSGHHVGVFAAPTPATVAVAAACRSTSSVLVPLAPGLAPDVLTAQARHADVDVLAAPDGEVETAHRVAANLGVPLIVAAKPSGAWRPAPHHAAPPDRPGHPELAVVLHTSGTTMASLAWALTRDAMRNHAERAVQVLGLTEESVVLAALPLFSVGAQAMLERAFLLRHTLVLVPRFDAAHALEAMARHEVTHISLVPVMLERLLKTGRSPPGSLQSVLVGGDAATPDILLRAWQAGWPVMPTYGLTEAGSQVATATMAEAKERPGTVGRPLPGVEVEVRGDTGRLVASGEDGRLFVRGDTMAQPYPSAGKLAWIDTGDLGHLDADGYLFITGRMAERIVTGGRTVDARDVEAVLKACPGVADACVVGLPDGEWGARVAALVEPVAGACLRPADVAGFARSRLAAHEAPRLVRVVPHLPRTPAGKPDRSRATARLRAAYDATVPT